MLVILSQDDLAAEAGMSRSGLAKIETGSGFYVCLKYAGRQMLQWVPLR